MRELTQQGDGGAGERGEVVSPDDAALLILAEACERALALDLTDGRRMAIMNVAAAADRRGRRLNQLVPSGTGRSA